ncbi:putative Cbb3-type cytochrome c oxidase subunit CcoP [Magnetofaba australis IT-1]|uniref:Putative Cbb3-type cytochrome c oxidase subunit CcoP n=1 Tax=Magnetofaba australis IT-1 TaxID=1434232 RepID=A0A1Y2K6A7_9PROT|nr:putative Cbb3-type cytochrome c oxidase subunit CcoP [Magnetofaba australis IT-1]
MDGFPTLSDDDWLYGGDLETIATTIAEGRQGVMPAKGGAELSDSQVNDLVSYVMSLSGAGAGPGNATAGDKLFHSDDAMCYTCHGVGAKGSLKGKTPDGEEIDNSIGAPNLSDGIWLYGGTEDAIKTTISKGRNGHMPVWSSDNGGKLSPVEVKKVALYVQSLGGGM